MSPHLFCTYAARPTPYEVQIPINRQTTPWRKALHFKAATPPAKDTTTTDIAGKQRHNVSESPIINTRHCSSLGTTINPKPGLQPTCPITKKPKMMTCKVTKPAQHLKFTSFRPRFGTSRTQNGNMVRLNILGVIKASYRRRFRHRLNSQVQSINKSRHTSTDNKYCRDQHWLC